MRIAIIGESICDTDSIKFIIQSVLGEIPIERRPSRGPIIRKLKSRISQLKSSYQDLVAIILIEDLDNANCQKKVNVLLEQVKRIGDGPIIVQIAIQKIEAWFLAMPDAVEDAFPNTRPFPRPRTLTDSITDPKRSIREIFRGKLGREYRETTDGPRIASRFKYAEKADYMNRSFSRFIAKIQSIQKT